MGCHGILEQGEREKSSISRGRTKRRGFGRAETPINKANEMAVESEERWNSWLVLTHSLIYPQCPCEHSGGNPLPHPINNIPQTGKKVCFPHQHPPQGPDRWALLAGGKGHNVVTHIEKKYLSLEGRERSTQASSAEAEGWLNILHRMGSALCRRSWSHACILWAEETNAFCLSHVDMLSLFSWRGRINPHSVSQMTQAAIIWGNDSTLVTGGLRFASFISNAMDKLEWCRCVPAQDINVL